LQEALAFLPEGTWLRTVRADSGFFDGSFLDFLEARAWPYVVVARMMPWASRFEPDFRHGLQPKYLSIYVELDKRFCHILGLQDEIRGAKHGRDPAIDSGGNRGH
jgi:hypothetical protein